MKPQDKKYILENINKKSIKEFSQELNIKERKIRKFLENKNRKEKVSRLSLDTFNKGRVLLAVVLIAILGFGVYANSLSGAFIWDDRYLVKDNGHIKDWSTIPQVFTRDITAGAGMKSGSYRPLQIVTYMINYSLSKLDVRGYHLTNVILHILVALCIYWFLNILYDDKLLSLFTSALFVAHPIHTNAVTYISGRADPLAAVFIILTFILYIRLLDKNNPKLYILILLTYICALLSRENSLILPVLLLLYHYTFGKKLEIKRLLPVLSVVLIYLAFRFTFLKAIFPHTVCKTTILERMPGFFAAMTNYVRLLFLPLNLHIEYGNSLFSLNNPKALAGIVILFSLLIYAFRVRKANRLVFFSILWFFITILPQSNLYPINAYMAEHWLYLPSIGLFLILAKGISLLYKNKRFKIFASILIIGLLSFYSFLTIRQNTYWHDLISFDERTLKQAPHSAKAHVDLGYAYDLAGEREKAMNLYKRAIEVDPDYEKAYNNLGVAYDSLGKRDEAVALLKKAIKLNPNYADPYSNLGIIYTSMGKHEEAIRSYEKAIEINPSFFDAYNNLGLVYKNLGEKEKAIELFKKSIEVNPFYTAGYNNLAVTYYYDKKYDLAVKYCDKALELGHNFHPEFLKLIKPHRK